MDGSAGAVPYYDRNEQAAALGPTFFSPNRQIPSPVMFGSLPTGVKANVPGRRSSSAHTREPVPRTKGRTPRRTTCCWISSGCHCGALRHQ